MNPDNPTISSDPSEVVKTKKQENMSQVVSNNDKKEQLLLSKNPTLQKKQLEVFSMLVTNTRIGRQFHTKAEGLAEAVFVWNSSPECVRNNPTLIKMVVMGSQYFEYDQWADITMPTIVSRVNILLRMEKIKLNGKKTSNFLAWLGKNHQVAAQVYVYNPQGLIDCIESPSYLNEMGNEVHQDCKFASDIDKLTAINMHNDTITVARWFSRIHIRRSRRKASFLSNGANQSLPQRFNRMIEHIVQTRPHNWMRSLNSHSLAIANRLRPSGECLGIELEFVATRGSDIVNWDSDGFPHHPWLQFKGDGSIRSNQTNESLAHYQELTWFINGSSPKDWKSMQEVLKTMTDNGAKVNNTCGSHVHIDMRHRTNQSALRTATKLRDAINGWAHRTVSFTRSHNHYCGIDRDHHGNRYTAVNTQCLSEHNTVEVRLGMPTLNFHKLKYWCALMQYLAKPYTSVATFEDFMQSDAPFDLKHYVIQRILKFQPTYVAASLPVLKDFDTYAIAVMSQEGTIE